MNDSTHRGKPPIKRCSCCPYGFHIDVGFLKSIEDRHDSVQRGRSSAKSLILQSESFGNYDSISRNKTPPSYPPSSKIPNASCRLKFRSHSFITPTNCSQSPVIKTNQPRQIFKPPQPKTSPIILSSKTNIKISNIHQIPNLGLLEGSKSESREILAGNSRKEPYSPFSLPNAGSLALQYSRNFDSTNKNVEENKDSQDVTISPRRQISRLLHRQNILVRDSSLSTLLNSSPPSTVLSATKPLINQDISSLKNYETSSPKEFFQKNISLNSPTSIPFPSSKNSKRYESAKIDQYIVPNSIDDLHQISQQLKQILRRVNEMESQASLVPALKRQLQEIKQENSRLKILLEKNLHCIKCGGSLGSHTKEFQKRDSLNENTLLNGYGDESKFEARSKIQMEGIKNLRNLNKEVMDEFTSIEDNMVSEDLKSCLEKISQNMTEPTIENLNMDVKEKLIKKQKDDPSKEIGKSKLFPRGVSKHPQNENETVDDSGTPKRTLNLFRSLPKSARVCQLSAKDQNYKIETRTKSSKKKNKVELALEEMEKNSKKEGEDYVKVEKRRSLDGCDQNDQNSQNSNKRFSFKSLNEQPRMNKFINSTLDKLSSSFKNKHTQQPSLTANNKQPKHAFDWTDSALESQRKNNEEKPNKIKNPQNSKESGPTENLKSSLQAAEAENENKRDLEERKIKKKKKKLKRSTSLTGGRDPIPPIFAKSPEERLDTKQPRNSITIGECSSGRKMSNRQKTLVEDPKRNDPVTSERDSTSSSSSSFDEGMYDGRLGRITFTTKPMKQFHF